MAAITAPIGGNRYARNFRIPTWDKGAGRAGLDPRNQARRYRLIVQRDGRRVRLFTRNGHDWSDRFPADHRGRAAEPEQLVRDRRRGRAARRRRPIGFQRPALAPARSRGRVLRLRYAGERRRGSPQAAAVDAQTNLARLLARRVDGIHLAPFEQGEIGPDLFRHACLMGLEGLGSKHRDQPISRRPIAALDQGQEPEASSLQPGAGSVWLG